MDLRLLGREAAAPDELRDERVVFRQLLELAVADEVGTRVADMTEPDNAVLDERDRDRRPHSRCIRVFGCPLEDALCGRLDEGDDTISPAPADVFSERGRGDAGGDLAAARAAHPVGDREERWPADPGVLVAPPLATRV